MNRLKNLADKAPKVLEISGIGLALATVASAHFFYKKDILSPLRGAKSTNLSIVSRGNPVVEGHRARFDVLVSSDSRTSATISFSLMEDGQLAELSAIAPSAEKAISNPYFENPAKKSQRRALADYHLPPKYSEEDIDSVSNAPLEVTGDYSTGYNAPDRVVEYTFLESNRPSQFLASALVRAKKRLCLTVEVSLPPAGSVIMGETECIQVRSVNK